MSRPVLAPPDQLELIAAAVRGGADPYEVRAAVLDGAPDRLRAFASRGGRLGVPAGGFVLLGGTDAYPVSLAGTFTPPPLLFGIGNPEAVLTPGVAVHGAATQAALGDDVVVAASTAARLGAPIVCGAAAGDGLVAARAAIQFGAPVVFVVATGPDAPATATAADLAGEVSGSRGVVVSEQPFGVDSTKDYRRRLSARHRIVAGLSAVMIPTSGQLPSDAASAVFAMLRLGRAVIVRRPVDAGGENQLPYALSQAAPSDVRALVRVGCDPDTSARLAGTDQVANATVDNADELALSVELLWRLSPHTPQHA